MKRFLLAALVASAFMAPQANAGPLRNLIRAVIHRPKPAPVAQVTTATPTTYVSTCSGGSGIVLASGGSCTDGSCPK